MENSLQKAHCAQRREEIAHRLAGGTLCTLPLWYVESSPGPLPPASPATSSWPRFSQAVPTLATQPYSRTHKLSSIGSSFRYKYNLEKTTHLDPRSPPRKTPKSGSAAEPEKHGSLGKLSKPHYELWLSERRRRVAGPGSGAKCTQHGRARRSKCSCLAVSQLLPWPAVIHEESLSPGVPSYCLCARVWVYSKVTML